MTPVLMGKDHLLGGWSQLEVTQVLDPSPSTLSLTVRAIADPGNPCCLDVSASLAFVKLPPGKSTQRGHAQNHMPGLFGTEPLDPRDILDMSHAWKSFSPNLPTPW